MKQINPTITNKPTDKKLSDLTKEELKPLVDFFLLLIEWDQKEKIRISENFKL